MIGNVHIVRFSQQLHLRLLSCRLIPGLLYLYTKCNILVVEKFLSYIKGNIKIKDHSA
jgi:hypothetical protein